MTKKGPIVQLIRRQVQWSRLKPIHEREIAVVIEMKAGHATYGLKR